MKALVLLIAVALSGCTVDDVYIAADRATYDIIAPKHADYIANDDSLTQEQKERRVLLLTLWRIRIEKAEKK